MVSPASSFSSIMSDDSYIAEWTDVIELQFKGYLTTVKLFKKGVDKEWSILKSRKYLSHERKKRDPNDKSHVKFTEQMEAEYHQYKQAVDLLNECKKKHQAALKETRNCKKHSPAKQQQIRTEAIEFYREWLEAAMV